TTQLGTARKPASRKRASFQPSSFEGILSHHAALPGPPPITPISLRRNESSTAFLSHWFTDQWPLAPRSATRALPRGSRSSAVSTASRTGPLVVGPMPSRCSKASSMILASSACDIGKVLGGSKTSEAVVGNRAGRVKRRHGELFVRRDCRQKDRQVVS